MEVLLYGCRKSGTTLFQRLLDGTDELFVHPSETKIKNYIKLNKGKEFPDGFSSMEFNDVYPFYFRAAKKKWADVNSDKYRNLIKSNFKSVKNLEDFIQLDIRASMSAMNLKNENIINWAIKEISGNTKEVIHSFLSSFPNGKIIAIYRDPRHIASAVYREKKRTKTKLKFRRVISVAKEPYRILKDLRTLEKLPQIYRVNYEELVKSPVEVMKGVADFLNIKYSDILTKPTLNGKICTVPSSSKTTTKVFTNKNPLSNNINWLEFCVIQFYSKIYSKTVVKYEQLSGEK